MKLSSSYIEHKSSCPSSIEDSPGISFARPFSVICGVLSSLQEFLGLREVGWRAKKVYMKAKIAPEGLKRAQKRRQERPKRSETEPK